MNKSYINAIGTANPEYKIPQMEVAGFMSEASQLDVNEIRKLKAVYKMSGIENRYTVLPDYLKKNGEFSFYPNTPDLEPFPTVGNRMDVYQKEALPLALEAAKKCIVQIENFDRTAVTHIITVSCTGMYAPGLDIELIHKLELKPTIERTAINFMGCYAAFNGLKAADHICRANPEATVLLVCIELCTLHFQKNKSEDHLLANAIFGDGAAALIISGKKKSKLNLRLDRFYCDLAPEGKDDMAWHVSDYGFEMTLTSYIPALVKGGIRKLAENLLKSIKFNLNDIHYYAIHPGGRRILEAIEQELGLTKEDNKHAYEVLRNYGNMSSPTVLFVLKSILDILTEKDEGKNILSFAFGPGLTMESMLLTIER